MISATKVCISPILLTILGVWHRRLIVHLNSDILSV